MKHAARGRYETSLDDPDFTFDPAVGRRWYYPGDIRMQEQGSVYGPEEAGPDGCYMLNIFKDRRGAIPSMLGAEDAEPIEIPPFIQLSKIWDQRRPDGADTTEGTEADTADVGTPQSEPVAFWSPEPAARRS